MNAYDPSLHVTPHNTEAEQGILGTLLLNNSAFDDLKNLEADHFFEPIHRRIFEAISELLRIGRKATPTIIKDFLPTDAKIRDGMNVGQYLAKLVTDAITVRDIGGFEQAIIEAHERRTTISAAQDAIDIAIDWTPGSDVMDGLEKIEAVITDMRAERIGRQQQKGMGQAYLDSMTEARQRGNVEGVPICLAEIGEVISEPCFEAGNLYGLLSSSGEGKTSLTLQIIAHAIEQGHPVHFQSYDQSSVQCVRQMAAQKFGIEARRQRAGDLAEKEWEKAVNYAHWLDRQPFEVIKCTDQSAGQLVGYAKAFVKRHSNGKVPLIVTDHIGSIKPEDRRADEGTKAKDINKILKAGAEIVHGAWLVLNQRNSFGMRRDNPRPISSDLFGGDPAKQAYDAILYLYRPEKFKAEREATAATDADWKKINKVFGGELEGVAEIGAIKVRFGSPNVRERLRFEDRFTRYKSERPQTDQGGLL